MFFYFVLIYFSLTIKYDIQVIYFINQNIQINVQLKSNYIP